MHKIYSGVASFLRLWIQYGSWVVHKFSRPIRIQSQIRSNQPFPLHHISWPHRTGWCNSYSTGVARGSMHEESHGQQNDDSDQYKNQVLSLESVHQSLSPSPRLLQYMALQCTWYSYFSFASGQNMYSCLTINVTLLNHNYRTNLFQLLPKTTALTTKAYAQNNISILWLYKNIKV